MKTVTMTHEERRARREAMAEDILRGESLGVVAATYGVSYGTACLANKLAGVRGIQGPGVKLSTFAILAKLLNSDASLTEIASEFSLTHQRVSQIYGAAIKAGIRVPRRRQGVRQ